MPAAAPVASAAPVAPAAPSSGSAGVSAEKATEVVLDVLAAKTGYEVDMLEMDMALETELGVDSIKRVEILSEVQRQLNIEAQDVAALSRTQTVGEVIDAMKAEIVAAHPESWAMALQHAVRLTRGRATVPKPSGSRRTERRRDSMPSARQPQTTDASSSSAADRPCCAELPSA